MIRPALDGPIPEDARRKRSRRICGPVQARRPILEKILQQMSDQKTSPANGEGFFL